MDYHVYITLGVHYSRFQCLVASVPSCLNPQPTFPLFSFAHSAFPLPLISFGSVCEHIEKEGRCRCSIASFNSLYLFLSSPGTYLIAVDPSHNTGFLWANPWPGRIGTLNARFSPYAKAKRMILPTASLVTPRTIFFVADPEVIKQVASDRAGIYEKDPQTYRVLNVYGNNIVSECRSDQFSIVCMYLPLDFLAGSNTASWKKQREAARAAFSEVRFESIVS